jgi:hypothetical protein
MGLPLLSRADAAVGTAIEVAVSGEHRRRLRRLGWERALEPPDDAVWAATIRSRTGGRDDPPTHRLIALPGVSKRSAAC